MPQLIFNNIDSLLFNQLKIRAASHRRTLEEELKVILQEAIETEQALKLKTFREHATKSRQTLSGRVHTDSSQLVLQDRER